MKPATPDAPSTRGRQKPRGGSFFSLHVDQEAALGRSVVAVDLSGLGRCHTHVVAHVSLTPHVARGAPAVRYTVGLGVIDPVAGGCSNVVRKDSQELGKSDTHEIALKGPCHT
jgi:hypothetical protein